MYKLCHLITFYFSSLHFVNLIWTVPKRVFEWWETRRKSSMFHMFPKWSPLFALTGRKKHQQENYTKNLWSWVFVIPKLNSEMFVCIIRVARAHGILLQKPSNKTFMKISQKQSRSHFHIPRSNATQHSTTEYNGYSTVDKVTKSRALSIFWKWNTHWRPLDTVQLLFIFFRSKLYYKTLSLNN